jgi:hypothetical protein
VTSVPNFGKAGPIESFRPMILFAIMFGLSMDYEVFLLSRMKEEYDTNGHDNREAVASGLAGTARVITAAAAIMACVFGSFVFGDGLITKEFGLGLAVAVLVDATVVRMILVPAAMALLGDVNCGCPAGWTGCPTSTLKAKPSKRHPGLRPSPPRGAAPSSLTPRPQNDSPAQPSAGAVNQLGRRMGSADMRWLGGKRYRAKRLPAAPEVVRRRRSVSAHTSRVRTPAGCTRGETPP